MIELNLNYTEKNLLDNLIFTASKSDFLKKSIKISWFAIGIILLSSVYILLIYNKLLSTIVFVVSLTTFFWVPKFHKFYVLKVLTKLSKSKEYKRIIGREYCIIFKDEYIESKTDIAELKYLYSGFESIFETGAYFFIKLDTPVFLIFPKDQINNINELRFYFKEICSKYKIPFLEEKNWTWK
jgi:hypothetical protein